MSFHLLLPAAILNQDKETLLSLLSTDIDVNANVRASPDSPEVTPLCLAAEAGFIEGVTLLVKHGADISLGTKTSVASAVPSTVNPGYIIQVHLKRRQNAIQVEPSPHSKGSKQPNRLLCALTSTSGDIRLRYSAEASDSVPSSSGTCPDGSGSGGQKHSRKGLVPLMAACRQGHLEVVEYLCKQLSEDGKLQGQLQAVDMEGHTALAAACLGGHLHIVQHLLPLLGSSRSIDQPNVHGLNTLMMATLAGNAELITLLLQQGASLNWTDERNYDVFMYGIYFGHQEVIRQLLATDDANALVQRNCSMYLELALGNTEILKLLVEEYGIPPKVYRDSNDNTILHRAVQLPRDSEALAFLLKNGGVGVNKVDSQCQTALSLLLNSSRRVPSDLLLEMATLLVEAGCDPNMPAPPRLSPLLSAVRLQHPRLVRLLVKGGANVCIEDLCEGTPLRMMLNTLMRNKGSINKEEVKDIIQCLIQADPGLVRPTPNHIAFSGPSIPGPLAAFLIQNLEEHGCDLHQMKSSLGLTVLQTGILRYNFHIVKYCLQRSYPLDTEVQLPQREDPVFILNVYIGWKDRLIMCTPEVDEFNLMNKIVPSKSRDFKCRRYTVAKMLTVTGVPWKNFRGLVTPSLRNACLEQFPLTLMQLCRNVLRNHYGSSYYNKVMHPSLYIPDMIRQYLLFSDFVEW